MKTRRGAVIAGLAVAVAVLAIGCAANDRMSIAEFVNKGYELQLKHEATAAPLHIKFDEATGNLAPADKLPAEVMDTLTALFDEEDRFAGQLDGIDAPKEAKDIQIEAVAALRADAAYGRKVVGALTNEATLGDLGAAYENDEGVAIEARREDACKSMQKLADDNGIKVGWNC